MPKILALPALLLAFTLAPAGCDVDDGEGPDSPRASAGGGPAFLADTDGDDGDTDTDTDGDGDEPQCTPRVHLPPITGGGPIGDCP